MELEKVAHSACSREAEIFIYRMAFPQFLQNQPPAGVRSSSGVGSEIFLLEKN